MRDFLWKGCDNEKADHLVASERIARPMEKRGYGIGNSLKRNEVLLGKWLRRFPLDESVWYKVIVSKYGFKENLWDSGSATHCCPWKAVESVENVYLKHVKWKAGSWDSIKFWKDI